MSVEYIDGVSMDAAWVGIIGTFASLLCLMFIARKTSLPSYNTKDEDAAAGVQVMVDDEERYGTTSEEKASTSEGGDVHTTGTQSSVPFGSFQRQFITVFLLATFTDWMKGPYTMAVYLSYGYSLNDVATFFAVTFLSSMVFGTFAGALSDGSGRVFMCRVFCILHALCLITVLSRNFYVLLFGRVMGGIATSLLFTSFESWMVTQHHDNNYDPSLLADTFSKTAFLNSLVAVLAGFVAEFAVAQFGFASPFLVPLPAFLIILYLVRHWPENYGDRTASLYVSLKEGLREIRENENLQLLGASEAFFEAAMGIWVFCWTPSIDYLSNRTPFGFLFVSFMLAMMCGGVISRLYPYTVLLPRMHLLALVSCTAAVLVFYNKEALLFCFVCYELSIGMYFVVHPMLRSTLMNDSSRSAVMNLFRVPLNLIIVVALSVITKPHASLMLVAFLQVCSTVCLVVLQRRLKEPSEDSDNSK